jgi:hypothetical protein
MHRASSRRGTSKLKGQVALACLALVGFAATSARAHGGPPAILQVVAADADGPRLVRTTEGFAQRLEERWVYVCPSLFGSTEVPRAIAHDDDDVVWLASVTGTFTLDRQGRVASIDTDGALTALALTADGVFGLRFRLQGTAVVRLAGGAMQVVHESDEPFTMLSASGDGLAVGRVEGEALVVQELGVDGELGARWSVEAALASKLVTLRAAESAAFATTLDNTGYALFALSERMLVPVLQAPGAILGPTRAADDQLWLSTYDALWRIEDDGLQMHPAAQWITCLDRVAGRSFACTQDRVLDFTGPELGTARMDLRDLEPPTSQDGDLVGDEACAADWLLFRADLSTIGIDVGMPQDAGVADASVADAGVLPVPDASEVDAAEPRAAARSSGCTVSGSQGRGTSWLALMCAALLRRRRRRHTRS